MRISIDGEDQPAGQKIVKEIRLRSLPKRAVEASSLDAAAATKRYKRSLWWTFGFIYFAIVLGCLLSLPKITNGASAIAFFAVVLLFVGAIVYFHRRDIRRWRERSAARIGELPPVGTTASASPESLTIFGASYPWSELKVEAVDFALKRSKRRSWLEVDRMRLLGKDGKSFMIDLFGYRNGDKLIDMAANRLWPQIQPAVNGAAA